MPQSITKSTVTRKFSIKKYLNEMSRGLASIARAELAKKLELTYHHFVRLTNATQDSHFILSSDQLLIISRYFGVSVDEILAPYEEAKN